MLYIDNELTAKMLILSIGSLQFSFFLLLWCCYPFESTLGALTIDYVLTEWQPPTKKATAKKKNALNKCIAVAKKLRPERVKMKYEIWNNHFSIQLQISLIQQANEKKDGILYLECVKNRLTTTIWNSGVVTGNSVAKTQSNVISAFVRFFPRFFFAF